MRKLFRKKNKKKLAVAISSLVITIGSVYGFSLDPEQVEVLSVVILGIIGTIYGIFQNNDKTENDDEEQQK